MDSYVSSLGNFAAGVGAEALAGATGQAAARRGRAGPGGSRRWLAHWLGSASSPLAPRPPLHLGHRRPVRAEAWKHERGSQRRGGPCISPHPPPLPPSLSSSPALRLRSLTQTEGALWPSASSASP